MAIDPVTVAAQAATGFTVLQCQECAENIKDALQKKGLHGQLIQIRGAGGRDFMICFGYDGGKTTITQNGRHVGVRAGDLVFDNLHLKGMPLDEWLKDFDAIGGIVVESTVDF
jgi:hypothetical protein